MKISIIIPLYNVEKYVSNCLESLLKQTLLDFEIIIVNDASPDKSFEIVKSYAAKDNRFVLIDNKINQGPMVCRKIGYQHAHGDFLFFLDSDDTLPNYALEEMYVKAIAEDADVVCGQFKYVYPNGSTRQSIFSLKYGSNTHAIYKSLLTRELGHELCAKLFKRKLLQEHNYPVYHKATNGEDGMIFYQLIAYAKKIVLLNRPVYNYMQNVNSSTKRRISYQGLQSIVHLNKIRIDVSTGFSDLSYLAKKYVTCVFIGLCYQGYKKDLIRILHENNMDSYLDFFYYKKYFSIKESLELLIRKYGYCIYAIKQRLNRAK